MRRSERMTTGRRQQRAMLGLLRRLAAGPGQLTLGPTGEVTGLAASATAPALSIGTALLQQAVRQGLVMRSDLTVRLTAEAAGTLGRLAAGGDFRRQHGAVEPLDAADAGGPLIDRHASTLGQVARMKDRHGAPFLSAAALAAGETLAADFERGQLQPRVTARLTPRLETRTAGARPAEPGEAAMRARSRVAAAVEAMGPELAGVALDICCFGKTLGLVERERQWPQSSARLLLRAALLLLARHYAPEPARAPGLRHWGAADFRPEL